MIKIELSKASIKRNEINVVANTANEIATDLFKNLKKDFANHKCNIHPNKTSILTVKVNPNHSKMIEIIKTSFCCQIFSDSIDLNNY